MIRIVCLAVMAVSAAAQDAVPGTSGPVALAVLEQTARQRTAEWEKLEQSLDSSIKPLLPCDPKAAAAIAAVSKASDARIAALAAYLHEKGKQASLQTASTRRVLESVQSLRADLSVEKSDLAQEKLGVNGQIAELAGTVTGSGQRGPSFAGPQDALRKIESLQRQRSDAADSGIGQSEASLGPLRDLVAQLQTRDEGLKAVQAAFETENVRWSAYYAARLGRAQTECAVTAPAAAQGKQK
jgi:hypothetical protein